ncbi:RsmD family RNA methyltransferase [Carboxylicivirga caseinilyticus]|uniref:RsmD family RNA methyltransferase n=1 Tax=Carboxylicivirga caseinilyticus TaxID=3417572 RepID=UPI003D345A3E|nr:RsmD family RNA methyltransferase [Marinilabiliaceae bacterium A049]
MRIISGFLKGRRFSPPKSFKARPTTDIARESLFNILVNRVNFEELKVLDLFAGTGSISYEFASRGCEDITTIELNYNHYIFIKKTIQELEIDQFIRILKADAFKYLQKTSEKFDLVFADPPFDLKNFDTIPDHFFKQHLLKEDGIFILEHSDKKTFESHPYFKEVKKYGKVHFSFFS